MGWASLRNEQGEAGKEAREWLEKTRVFLQVLGRLGISPGRRQELQQLAEPGCLLPILSSVVSQAAPGLAEPSTDTGVHHKERYYFFFSPVGFFQLCPSS